MFSEQEFFLCMQLYFFKKSILSLWTVCFFDPYNNLYQESFSLFFCNNLIPDLFYGTIVITYLLSELDIGGLGI